MLRIASSRGRQCGHCHPLLSLSLSLSLTPIYHPRIGESELVSVLIVGLSFGARNVLSYTRRMMQNFLAFRDSPIIPLRRSHTLIRYSPSIPSVGTSHHINHTIISQGERQMTNAHIFAWRILFAAHNHVD